MTGIFNNVDPRRIPIIGDDIYQVGQVYDIVSQPCGPDPVIAVKAMFAYAPSLIWSLLKPETFDMAFDRAKRGHSRKRKHRAKIRELHQLQVKNFGGVGYAAFNIANMAQRLGWYLIVADATTDWAINWTSLAYQWEGCNVPNPKWALYKGPSRYYIEPWASPTSIVGGSVTEQDGDASATVQTIAVFRTGPYSITYSGRPNIVPFNGVSGQVTACRIKINDGIHGLITEDCKKLETEDGNTIWTGAYRQWQELSRDVRATVEWEWTGGALAVLEQTFKIDGTKGGGLTFDP